MVTCPNVESNRHEDWVMCHCWMNRDPGRLSVHRTVISWECTFAWCYRMASYCNWVRMPSIQLRGRGLADEVALTQTPKQHYSRGRSEKSNTKSVCVALYMRLPGDFTLPERFMKAMRLPLGITSLRPWWWWCKCVWSDMAKQTRREGEGRLSQQSIDVFQGEEEVGSCFWQCRIPGEICYHIADSTMLLCIPRVWDCTNAPS